MILSDEKTRYLEGLQNRVSEIEQLLSFEEVLVDSKLTSALQKELSEIFPLVQKYKKLKQTAQTQSEYENLVASILDDITQKTEEQAAIIYIQPQNKLSSDLKFAYKKVCEMEGLNFSEETQFLKVSGQNALKFFENENGLHRSENEDVSVIVFPEPQNAEEFKIEDVRIDIFHSSGAGGQNVNKVATAVRATHTKTGLSAVCQDERTQFQNKARAIENLRDKYEKAISKKHEREIAELKKQYKSDKLVRTYNYKTNVVKDTKSNLSISLSDFFARDLGKILKSNISRS